MALWSFEILLQRAPTAAANLGITVLAGKAASLSLERAPIG